MLTNGGATAALTSVQNAVGTVSDFRSSIGALQSQFSFRGNIVDVQTANTENAVSALLDVDLAEELSNFYEKRALTEASIAGQSQSGQLSQSLLNLVR